MRPPKPSDRDSTPRYRSRNRGCRATLDALSQLIAAPLETEHFSDLVIEMGSQGNDRAAAILAARHLEDALAFAIVSRLKIDKNRFPDLFGYNRPLGTFDNKIRFSYAIRLVTEETRTLLDVIRSIRNAFAHALIPIQFTTKQVSDACSLIIIPDPLPPVYSPLVPESFEPIETLVLGRAISRRVIQSHTISLWCRGCIYNLLTLNHQKALELWRYFNHCDEYRKHHDIISNESKMR